MSSLLARLYNPFKIIILCLLLPMVLLTQLSMATHSAEIQASREPKNVVVPQSGAGARSVTLDPASKQVASPPEKTAILDTVFSGLENHKLAVFVIIVICLAETALIAILVLQRRRRKKAEASLLHKTEELDQFFQVSIDLLCVANAEGYFERLNPAFERILGYTTQELMAKPFLEFVHPDDRLTTREAIAALASQKSVTAFSNRYITKDGTVHWLEWNAVPVGNRTYAAARDVTERKRAEEALDERLQFERLLSEVSARFVNIPPALVDGEIKRGLRRILEFFQVERCGLLETRSGKNVWQVTHAAMAEGVPPVPLRTELPVSIYPWTYDRLVRKGEVVAFSRLDEVPAEATTDRQTWIEWGIRSALYIPMIIREPVTHAIAIDSIKHERVWPEEFIPRLRLLGEIFLSALERKQIRLELEERLRFEQLTSDLLGRFVNLPSEAVDDEINRWLRSITEFFEADRCSLGLFSEDNTRLVRFLEYHSLGAQPAAEFVSEEQMPWYFEQLLQGNPVVMNGIENLPPEAERERQFCVARGMKSVLSVPMVSGGNILGSCALVSGRAERVWPEDLVHRFRFISDTFASALARKQADEALREAERRYHTVADFTYDWEYWLAPEERMLYVSPSAERMTGYSAAELIDRPGLRWEIIIPEDRAGVREHFLDEFRDPRLQGVQFRICTRDGETRWIDHVCQPVTGARGETLGVRASNRDITALKQAEAEAFHARKDLLRTDRLLRMGELTASLAHELNQPLTSILSNARAALRFIQSGNLDLSELKEILEDIAQDDKRASDIIRSLRSMVRPEEGERESLRINDVAREAVTLFHSESVIRNIQVATDLAERLPAVMIDKVLILQVLVNLLMNAAESIGLGPSDDREIVLATQAADDSMVRVAVRDSGAGIEVEDVSKIFDPFFTTKRSGLGMGLSLSRSIIEAHGGRIWAENNPDRGVTFYFELPAVRTSSQ